MTADPTETLRALMPFAATLGIDLLRYEPEEVRARLSPRRGSDSPPLSFLCHGWRRCPAK
jgi:acyl-coenzyme A thioesterase PaaI-like protein